jgi:hypothetical protein
MIKSFLQFINENHDDSSELADLESLYSLGMIDDDQYYSDAIRILKSSGEIPSHEPRISAYWDDSEYTELYDVGRSWTGHHGERILELTANMDDMGDGKIKILLDTGIDCTFICNEYGEWKGASAEISVADHVFTEQDVFESGLIEDEDDGFIFQSGNGFEDDLQYMLDTICKLYGKMAVDSLIKKIIR